MGKFLANCQIFTLQIFSLINQYCTTIGILFTKMAGLLKYFRRSSQMESDKEESTLPDSNGALSKTVLSSSITLTNTIVSEVLENLSCGKCRSCRCLSLTLSQKFSVGKWSAENRVIATATICYYARVFPVF